MEDDDLSSIVNFEMPKLFGERGAKKGFFKKKGFLDESQNVKSLRGEMLGKKQVISSLEQELGDVQDIRFARDVARKELEEKRIKCMNMVDEVLELQDKLGIPPDESFDDNIENMDSATLDLRMTELSHVGYITSTDIADFIVKDLNYPFRKAYSITAKIVNLAEKKVKKLMS